MRTMHAQLLQHQLQQKAARRKAARSSPVGRAVIKKEEVDSVTELMEYMTAISVQIYMTPDGERDTKLLANLALVLSIGTEIALALVPDHGQTKQMHAALRTVMQFSCLDGGRWQSAQAKRLHEAAKLASDVFLERPVFGTTFFQSAFDLAQKVRNGTARMSDVAGAEIYNKESKVQQ